MWGTVTFAKAQGDARGTILPAEDALGHNKHILPCSQAEDDEELRTRMEDVVPLHYTSRCIGRGPCAPSLWLEQTLRLQHLSSWDPSLHAALAPGWAVGCTITQPTELMCVEHLHPDVERLIHPSPWKQICTQPLVSACEMRLRKALTWSLSLLKKTTKNLERSHRIVEL